jgi:hypothetical protein
MKANIVRNENRKTLTVVLTPISISYVDYLYKKYKDERYFASGVLKGADYKYDIVPFVEKLANELTAIGQGTLPPGTKISTNDLITLSDEEYRLFTRNIDRDGNWDKQFKINLTNRSKDTDKRFLFLDLEQTKPIPQQDGWKHNYAIEIEVGVGFDEKTAKPYVFAIFHRAMSVGLKENNTFQANNSAWKGLNLETLEVKDEDLPF